MIIPKTKQDLVKAFWDRVAIVDDEDIEWLLSTHNQQVIDRVRKLKSYLKGRTMAVMVKDEIRKQLNEIAQELIGGY